MKIAIQIRYYIYLMAVCQTTVKKAMHKLKYDISDLQQAPLIHSSYILHMRLVLDNTANYFRKKDLIKEQK